MDNSKDLTNLDKMIDYFSIKKEYELVGTLQRARYTLFPDLLQKELEGFDSKEAEEEIDRIIETLQTEVDYFEEQDRRKFRLPSSKVKTIAISLGQAGLHYINMAQEKRWWDCDFLAIDSDKDSLLRSKTPHTFLIGGEGIEGPFNGNQEKGKAAFKVSRNDLKNRLSEYKDANVIIIANAAGATAGALADLISLCQEVGIDITSITVGLFLPFSFESTQRCMQAKKIKNTVEEMNINVVAIENSEALKYCDRRTNISYALDILDQIMANRIAKEGAIRKEERMGLK